MRAGKSDLGAVPPGGSSGEWNVAPESESLAWRAPIHHPALRWLSVACVAIGVVIWHLAPQAIDDMSMTVILSKAWFLIIAALIVYLLLVRARVNHVSMDRSLKKLILGSKSLDACPVQLWIYQSGVVTGTDIGVAWVENGSFHFLGGATKFSLPRQALPPYSMWSDRDRKSLRHESKHRFVPLADIEPGARLVFDCLHRFDDHTSRRRAAAFDQSLIQWMKSSDVPNISAAKLPPLSVYPHLVFQTKFMVEIAAQALILVLLFASVLGLKFHAIPRSYFAFAEVLGESMALVCALITVIAAGLVFRTAIVRQWLAQIRH